MMLIGLLFILSSRVVSSMLTYMIPTIPSSQLASHCPASADRCLTLNELIDSNTDGSGIRLMSDEEIVFQSGEHIVNGTRNVFLFVYNVRHLTFQGQPNVTITCETEFYFEFAQVTALEISNIHFKNCNGRSPKQKSTISYTLRIYYDSSRVILDKVEITSSHSRVGMVLDSVGSVVTLTNSKIATGGIGLYSQGYYSHRGTHRLNIRNTIFSGSCLEFNTKYVTYNIQNTTFEKCTCSTVLSFQGVKKTITLADIMISDNDSPYVIHAVNSHKITIKGHCHFHRNKGTIAAEGSSLTFHKTDTEFINNTIFELSGYTVPGTTVFLDHSILTFEYSHVLFKANYGQHSGGITAKRQTLIVFKYGSVIDFIENRGDKGGAISLYGESLMEFYDDGKSNLTLNFVHNEAQTGGAVYIEDSDYLSTFGHNLSKAVIQLYDFKGKVKLHFTNNTAQVGGNDIFGGWVDWYVAPNLTVMHNPNASEILVTEGDGDMYISSNAVRICICIDGIPSCNITQNVTQIYPGQTVSLKVVAVGQRFGTVITFVTSTVVGIHNVTAKAGKISSYQRVQITQRTCSDVNYTISSPNKKEKLMLIPLDNLTYPMFDTRVLNEHPDYALLFRQFSIILNLKDCPLAYQFDKINHKCVCLPSLSSLGLTCNLDTYRILRSEHQWVGMAYVHTIPEENPGVIAHQNCPLDYCRTDKTSLLIDMEFPDYQCSSNRGGILCGACQTNFSNILGSSRCKKCSHIMLLAIIPGVLLAGILLIIFLMLLNLTVSVGTINGLIFYANIIQSQRSSFFSPGISESFLSKFIAWLNLELGIETCLYNGLDSYAKMWLQLLFPFYTWLMLAAIIISSYYSTTASQLSGKNAVQVLATLFLLSYTKLVRVVIAVFSSTVVIFPDGHTIRVWFHDGNVEFLKGKHLMLFITSLLFLMFFLVPYTLSLVTIQWLLKISNYKVMYWIRKLKPLFDAYAGPYKDNHRYWTGFLLLVRIILLTTFSLNQSNYPPTNLMAITVVSVGLLTWLYFTRWVYINVLNNYLEITFICNLGITSATILFKLANHKEFSAVTHTSIGITLVLFIAIVLYHAQNRLLQTRPGSTFKEKFTKVVKRKRDEKSKSQVKEKDIIQVKPTEITYTVVELTQPLIQDEEI